MCRDLRYLDVGDFFETVPCTKLLLNKFFMLAEERIRAADRAAAAAAADQP